MSNTPVASRSQEALELLLAKTSTTETLGEISVEVRENLARGSRIPDSASRSTGTMVEEIVAADRRLSSVLTLIPFVGPFLLGRSEVHSRQDKLRLLPASGGITAVALLAIAMLIPGAAQRSLELENRIDSDLRELHNVAESFRAERSGYPDTRTWKLLAERADPRFYDPWGRPYRYDATGEAGITLGSFGRDGEPGGEGEDADVEAHFPGPTETARLAEARDG